MFVLCRYIPKEELLHGDDWDDNEFDYALSIWSKESCSVQYTIQNTVQLITYDTVPLKRPYIFGIYLQDN